MSAAKTSYYQRFNEHLFDLVPKTAKRILDVGCAEGKLGSALKRQTSDRIVYGVEYVEAAAIKAADKLDKVFNVNVEVENLPIESNSLDCIIYGDVLEHLIDPEAVLYNHRRLLRMDGIILCSIPNIQHHSIITSLIRGDFQYTAQGLLDRTHLRFFTASTFIKLLLDSGFEPVIEKRVYIPAGRNFYQIFEPVIRFVGAERRRVSRNIDTFQYIFSGTPTNLWDFVDTDVEVPITFVVNVTNDEVFKANLLSSPCFNSGGIHELIAVSSASNVAVTYNNGLDSAKNDIIVFVHEDVYLPKGWTKQFVRNFQLAEKINENVGVVGVLGASIDEKKQIILKGRVIEEDIMRGTVCNVPQQVETVDECLFAFRKTTGLRFDEQMASDILAVDISLFAKKSGKKTVVIDSLCYHNNTTDLLGWSYYAAARRLACKWSEVLPVATTKNMINRSWKLPSHRTSQLFGRLQRWLYRTIWAFRAP